MRLLIVSGIFHPDVGGPATYLHELAHALTRDGHEVAVLAYGVDDPPGRYPFPVWRVSRAGSSGGRMFRFTRTLFRVSRGYPLWYVNDYGIPALLVAAVRRPRIVMKIVGDFAWEYGRRKHLVDEGIDAFQTRHHAGRIELLKRVQRRYARAAARVIVPSAYLARLVRGWGVDARRIVIIPNAASWTTVAAAADTAGRDAATLFCAARLAPWKGMDHLLHTLAILTKEMPEARLVVAGDGPESARLRALAAELGVAHAVTWLGDVDRGQVLYWMRRATLFVLLSEYEGLSHVLLEAMAEGLPVVASPAGGNTELIADGRDGLLVSPADHAGTAARMRELIQDAGLRARLTASARVRVQDHTWERLFTETRSVFETASGAAP